MPLQQEFLPTAQLSAVKLKQEIADILAGTSQDELTQPGVADPPTVDDYVCNQKAGTGVEVILVTFATKVAYDAWKQIILPRLRAKYGGAALTSVGAVRETPVAHRK